jgi:excinuclease UvrABC helicase subunit UvrB
MKIYVVHAYLGCCANNSDGKMWIVADDIKTAIKIAKQNTDYKLGKIEEYNFENEMIFSTFRTKSSYRLENKKDNWGYWEEINCCVGNLLECKYYNDHNCLNPKGKNCSGHIGI